MIDVYQGSNITSRFYDGSSGSFGVGIVIVLETPLTAIAMQLIPWIVVTTAAVSAPLSWFIAPILRTRFENRTGTVKPSVASDGVGLPT